MLNFLNIIYTSILQISYIQCIIYIIYIFIDKILYKIIPYLRDYGAQMKLRISNIGANYSEGNLTLCLCTINTTENNLG
jgi:hypothetical protein